MNPLPKPAGYPSLSPYLVVDGAQRVIAFLKQAFDATELRWYDRAAYVPDVDATSRRAPAAGAVSVQEPQQREGDPDRRGGVKDPAGNSWWISTQVT